MSATPTEKMCAELKQRWETYIADRIRIQPSYTNRASAFGHPCEWYAYLNRARWQTMTPPSQELQKIFERGNVMEPAVKQLCEKLGIRIEAEQRPISWDKYQITGHFDGMIHWQAQLEEEPISIVAEVKTTANPRIAGCMSVEELRKVRPMGERYYAQVQVYLLGAGVEHGVLIVYDVTTGELGFIPISLDMDEAQALIDRAERINVALELRDEIKEKTGLEPNPEDVMMTLLNDVGICKRCPHYGTNCTPDAKFGEGVQVLADPLIEEKLDRRDELAPAGLEFKAVDKSIKDRVKRLGDQVLCGDWLIDNKPHESTRYDVPQDVKAQYAVTTQVIRTSFTRIKDKDEGEQNDDTADV